MVGLLCAVLLVMFIVYRMRKKVNTFISMYNFRKTYSQHRLIRPKDMRRFSVKLGRVWNLGGF